MREPRRISIYPVLLVNFIGALGYSVILPFLIFLVTRFGGNAFLYGVLGATYPALQLIGAPILGRWSDSYGRKKVLFLSQAGTLVSWIVFGAALYLPVRILLQVDSEWLGTFALTLPLVVLFLARAMDGLTGGNISVANAYLADVTPDADRNKNFGKLGISANLGFILGPALAGLLGATAYGEVLPVLGVILISVIGTLVVGVFLPESNLCVIREDPEPANVGQILGQEHKKCFKLNGAEPIGWRGVFRLRRVPYMLLLYFLIFLGFNLFYTAFPFYAVHGLKWDVTQTGLFFSVLSVMMVVVQGPVLSRLSKKCSDPFLVLVGSLILGISFLPLVTANNVLVYLAAALFALGNGLMWPSVLSILSKVAGDEHQGAVQGFASSCGSLASIIGLIGGGILFGFLGAKTFFVPAAVILLAALLSIRLMGVERTTGD